MFPKKYTWWRSAEVKLQHRASNINPLMPGGNKKVTHT